MEPLTTEELAEIVARDLPGHELVSHAAVEPGVDAAPADTTGMADEPGVDIEALRARFLGGDAPVYDGVDSAPRAPLNEHDRIVAVRPDDVTDPFDQRARPRTVIISGRERRVIGEQG